MLAAIDFSLLAKRLTHVPTRLLQYIRHIEPTFQVTAAQLTFLILFVACPLERLLVLDFVLGKLRRYDLALSHDWQYHPAKRFSQYPNNRNFLLETLDHQGGKNYY